MTVINRLIPGEKDPVKIAAAVNQMAEYIDRGLVKLGSFTRDTSLATGTQAITGVGFKPRAVIFLAGVIGGSNDNSVGFDDGASPEALVNLNALTTGTFHTSSVASIRFVQSALNIYAGLVQSRDADGFTISWTKTGSPTGTRTIFYLALG